MSSTLRTGLITVVAALTLVSTPACSSDTALGGDGNASTTGATPSPSVRPAGTADLSPTAVPSGTADPNAITSSGFPDLTIGATIADLVADGVIVMARSVCGVARDPNRPYVSLVFHDDRLVLIWAYPPLHTPERIQVGTPVTAARAAYPQAIELTRPAGSEQFAGLLIPGDDDSAYLLLHDGNTVQKLIVGAEHYLRLLFDTRFGTC